MTCGWVWIKEDYNFTTYEMLHDMFRGENLGETVRNFTSNLGEHSPKEPNKGS